MNWSSVDDKITAAEIWITGYAVVVVSVSTVEALSLVRVCTRMHFTHLHIMLGLFSVIDI